MQLVVVQYRAITVATTLNSIFVAYLHEDNSNLALSPKCQHCFFSAGVSYDPQSKLKSACGP